MPRVWVIADGAIRWVAQNGAGGRKGMLVPLLGPHPVGDFSEAVAARWVFAFREHGQVAGADPEVPPCDHAATRNLYDQRPPSEGRRLKAEGRLCADCGAMFAKKGGERK